MKQLAWRLVWSLSFLAAPGIAQAQMFSPMLSEGPRIALQDHADRFAHDPDALQARGQPAASPAALRYTPSKVRRSANLAAFVQKTRAADPQGAADLQTLFAGGDFIEKIGAAIAPHGFRIDDVADAYALWWLTAWEASRGNNDTPSREILAAVRAQAASAVTAAGEIAQATDAQKQELAEALWIQMTLIDTAVEHAKHNPARLREVGVAVRKGARGMGLDLDRIELTPHGFVPVGTH